MRTTLIICAHAAAKMKNTYFAAQFKRISAYRGKKRAYVAVAHSMLNAIYHILNDGVKYQDLGDDYYNQFNRERKINAYLTVLFQNYHRIHSNLNENFPRKMNM